MLLHSSIEGTTFKRLVLKGLIALGGNRQLKIYGTLHCASGKRMKVQNRVFFASERQALDAGHRPCGHCLRNQYLQWKATNNK